MRSISEIGRGHLLHHTSLTADFGSSNLAQVTGPAPYFVKIGRCRVVDEDTSILYRRVK